MPRTLFMGKRDVLTFSELRGSKHSIKPEYRFPIFQDNEFRTNFIADFIISANHFISARFSTNTSQSMK